MPSGIANAQAIVKSEEAARLELRACQERLEQLESIIGPHGNADVKELAGKLEEGEKKMRVLEANLKVQEAVRCCGSHLVRSG